MKLIKIITISLLLSTPFLLESQPAGVAAVKLLTKNLDTTVKTSLPPLLKISQACGENAGTGALKMIGAGVTKTTTALSTGASKGVALVKAAAASPLAPYVVVGVGTGYVVYKVYYHYNPTTEMKTLRLQKQAELNEAQMRVIETQVKLLEAKEKLNRLLLKA